MKLFVLRVAVAFLLMPVSLSFAADETKTLGTFKAWSAHTFVEQGHTVCFMASKPTQSLPETAKRSEIYAQVTHRPSDNSKGVFSVAFGYTLKSGTEATLTIGKTSFPLMTQGDTAWAKDETTDAAIAAAMKSGSTMTVEGLSARGTKTTDTYSLAGTSAAFKAINQACGVQ